MTRAIDLTGQRFGMLVVNSRYGSAKPVKWNTTCDCGNSKIAVGSELRRGRTTHCGCVPKNLADMKGQKYGLLTALFPYLQERRGVNKAVLWAFQCDCGNITLKQGSSVRAGATTSCGCLNGYREEHGMTGTSEHNAWVRLRPQLPPEMYAFSDFFKLLGQRPSENHAIAKRDINEPHGTQNTYWRANDERDRLPDFCDFGIDIGALITSGANAVAAGSIEAGEAAEGRSNREEATVGYGPVSERKGGSDNHSYGYQEAASSRCCVLA